MQASKVLAVWPFWSRKDSTSESELVAIYMTKEAAEAALKVEPTGNYECWPVHAWPNVF